ncbi:23496_t:CDS:2, partial [Gigaspora rosea]
MPCCIDTIVKIIQVCQTDKDELNLTVVWALSTYPVESEDHEMEVSLFVPVNEVERDPNAQSVFVKGEYYSICGKVVPSTYNGKFRLKMTAISSTHLTIRRDPGSNRCPLKASLVGIVQDIPKEVDSESAMFMLTVNDYAAKNYCFTVRIVFLCHNSRFKYLMNSACPNESVLFIVGHLEVIKYVYAANTSLLRSVRSRLLVAHENVIEKSCQPSSVKSDQSLADSVAIKDCNECSDISVDSEGIFMNESKKASCSYGKGNKGKEKMTEPVVHNTRSR